jgi:tetratricopeptide (TPR) repeat protein
VYEARAEFDLARQYYRQALQVDPNMAVATVALGRLLERENRLGEALALLEEASLQSGDDAATANSIGEMFLRMGQPNRAVDAFQVALERDNSFPDARINLTEYYLNTGQQTRAIEYIDQMVAAGIDSPRVRFLNARALHGQERYEQGISLMLELLEDEPENTVYLMHLGQLQFRPRSRPAAEPVRGDVYDGALGHGAQRHG